MGITLSYEVRVSKQSDTALWSKTIDSLAACITGSV